MMNQNNRNLVSRTLVYLFLLLIAFVSLYPIYFSFITSFKTVQEYTLSKTALPEAWVMDNYAYVFRNLNFLSYLMNSVFLVFGGMIVYLFVCNAAGFALGMLRFRFKLSIFSFILFFQIFPQMVIAAQVYRICSRIGLMNSHFGLILVWVAYFAPFGTYIMSTYYATMPRSLIESARIDGAGVFRQLFKIMMPMAAPMVGTVSIVGSLAMWTELPFSLLLIQDPGKRPLSLGIAIMKGEHGIPIPILTAAILVSALIPLVAYFFFQKNIHMGSTAGAVKG
ncbi:MAG: carbohydrate ABC transporter permease [Spirochaetales bacterium]|nr:carbohydrate ABC transporter permease [Spirochaetales bacterium]